MRAPALVQLSAMMLFAFLAAPLGLAAQGLPSSGGSLQYTAYDLGTLGGSVASGNAINDLGWAMGNANLAGDGVTHAAVWINGMHFDLGTLGGANSVIEWPVHNDLGVISGFSETAALDPLNENWSCSAFFPTVTNHVCVGFRYFAGAMTPLPTLGGTNGYAAGANQLGEVVGWAENSVRDSTCNPPQVLQFEAVRWSLDGKIHVLAPLPGDLDGAAVAINIEGDAVGISGTCDNAVGAYTAAHAVIWHEGRPSLISTFGGQGWNTPTDINGQGQVVGFADLPGDVVGGVLQFNPVAFIWSEAAGTQQIPPLPGDTNSIAYAINDRGVVVGQSFGGAEGSRAFIWVNGISYDLNSLLPAGSALYLIYAEGINDRGEITGQACSAFDGSCAAGSEAPAYLAIPQWNTGPRDAAVEAGAQVTVPPELYRRAMRRWGLDR
jgi:probable HAF family extracellular repeat protein